jgi:hypothetical protein
LAVVVGLAGAQACDSGSSTALFGDGEGGDGATSGRGGSQAGKGASSGSQNGGSQNGGSQNGGSQNSGSSHMGGAPESAGGIANPSAGGAGEDAGGAPSSAGQPGMGGVPAEAGQGGNESTADGGDPGVPICDQVLVSVEARVPNVVFMIDRSGTMFDVNSQPWAAVRDAALTVIGEMDGELDLGFLSMTGEAGSCPLLDEVAPAPDNYAAIAAKYNALAKPTKGESPFMLALGRAGELLAAGPGNGEAHAVMVVDGEPDYCNDGNPACAIDSVVARIQALRSQGFVTLIAGLPNTTNPTQHAASLQSYANAGLGLPVTPVGGSVSDIYYQCTGSAGWAAELATSGKPAQQALGSYSNSAGAAPFTSLDPSAGGAALTAALRSLLARTKSCRFDVEDFDVNVAQANFGTVTIDDQEIPFSAQNGWHMVDADELELVGSACTAWRVPAASQITVKFPCDVLSQ